MLNYQRVYHIISNDITYVSCGSPCKVVPHPSYKLVYKPHEYYRCITKKIHIVIGVMFTNLAFTNWGITLL